MDVKTDPEVFIRSNTTIMSPPHVPEIRLHLASEAHDLWLKTEDELQEIDGFIYCDQCAYYVQGGRN